jgi:glycerol-3-phosphate acyltransferase PlsX
MGTDNSPVPDVEGAVLAAREMTATGDTIVLIGEQSAIQVELKKHDVSGLALEVIHSPQTVTMHDKPSQVHRTKPESSMAQGLDLVKQGKADAFVSLGNTGAVLALATLGSLRRIPGVKRPAITTFLKVKDRMIIFCDLGANADARPEWLVQFGIMGSIYAESVLGYQTPTVGVLSNGEEEGKGNELVRAAAALMSEESRLKFIGNIEPKELIAGKADVVVADGFVGNIALKSMEALGDYLFGLMKSKVLESSSLLVKIGAVLMRPALREVYREVDPFEIGGAPLLGVNGVVITGHGRSNAKAVKNAIGQAKRAAQSGVIAKLQATFAGGEDA